ncbi:MAG: tetratricopeptide repeat protein, partial [FCB group bacterium]|nr:tetratricopeptide repeat protein [FCB group bacterium]
MKKLLFFLILLIMHISAFASVIDSLNTELNKSNANKGIIYNQLSIEYLNISPDKSVEYAKSALEQAESYIEQVDYTNQIGVAYEYSGKYTEALLKYNEALKLAESNSYSMGKGIALLNIAIAKTQLADYDNALDFSLRALKIFENENDKNHLASTLNNLGNIYLQINDPNRALQYYEIVLQNRQEIGNEHGIAKILHNIALVHIELKELDKAFDYLE